MILRKYKFNAVVTSLISDEFTVPLKYLFKLVMLRIYTVDETNFRNCVVQISDCKSLHAASFYRLFRRMIVVVLEQIDTLRMILD